MDDGLIKEYSSKDPLELVADDVTFGRDYSLNALPKDEFGNLLFQTDEKGKYDTYLDWLADYLYEQKIGPHEKQEALCKIVSSMDKERGMQYLGMYAALHEYMLIDVDTLLAIEERITDRTHFTEEDITWICNRSMEIAREYEKWASAREGEPGVFPKVIVVKPLASPLERENVRQHLREEAEQMRLYDYPGYDFCDVGWRVPLSVLLRDVDDKTERIRLLDVFFDIYMDYCNK